MGIFVENRLGRLLAHENVQATVIAPVPWFPFKTKLFGKYGRMARAGTVENRNGVTVYHPRYFVFPKLGMNLVPKFMYFSAVRCLRKLLAQGVKADVIDGHYLYPDGVVAAWLGATFDIPVVVTARGSDVTQIAHLRRPGEMIQSAIKEAFHVITVSKNLKNDLVHHGAEARKISVLRNGVDLDKFQPPAEGESRKQWANGPVLLFAGWLIERKRVDLVIEVTSKTPGLTAVIVGDGPLKQKLGAMAKKLNIEDRVIFTGQLPPEEMSQIYGSADVLMLSSEREGWANVLLEAMACGTPVVARAVGSAPDLVTDHAAGRLVDSADPDDLCAAVADLLENLPNRSDTRAFAEKFDWRSTSKGQKSIFDAAIAYQKTHQVQEYQADEP